MYDAFNSNIQDVFLLQPLRFLGDQAEKGSRERAGWLGIEFWQHVATYGEQGIETQIVLFHRNQG
jgi:hypothetical protein